MIPSIPSAGMQSIRDIQQARAMSGPQAAQAAREAHSPQEAQPRQPQGISSPLEGISGEVQARAYTYWPKQGEEAARAGDGGRPSPMETMLMWSKAISNVVSGMTVQDMGGMPTDTLSAALKNQQAAAGAMETAQAGNGLEAPKTGCETCQSRKYKDGSNDSGVSFQSARSMPASTAGIRVASHEGEHMTRETAKANKEGDVITNKRVTFQYGCCPECNKMYIKGGLTSFTKQSTGEGNAVAAKQADMLRGAGEQLNMGI